MTPNPKDLSEREALAKLISFKLRGHELNDGGNILDALATYHDQDTVKEALEIVGDWSVWLANDILSHLASRNGGETDAATPPPACADQWRDIASAPSQEGVMVGHVDFKGWQRLAIKNALGEWSYDDRPWLQQDPLDLQPTHWRPRPFSPALPATPREAG